jgi:NAD(P)-dependent dehydrogenase (short-subunit alcohol dehydrogenase family)
MTALRGQVALVTGAARGIGAATVSALRAAGAVVVPFDIDPGVQTQGDALVGDVGSERDVQGAVASVLERHGRWDALVNNAGVGRHNPIEAIRAEDLDLMWSVNVRGTVLLTRAAFRHMSTTGRGQVLNVVSTAGLRGEPGESAYCATKAAVRGFTEAAAEEGRLHGIRVHGIYPAGVDTGFWADATVSGPGVDPSTAFLAASDVAAAVVAALSLPEHVHVPELVVRALADGDTARTRAKLLRFQSDAAPQPTGRG